MREGSRHKVAKVSEEKGMVGRAGMEAERWQPRGL